MENWLPDLASSENLYSEDGTSNNRQDVSKSSDEDLYGFGSDDGENNEPDAPESEGEDLNDFGSEDVENKVDARQGTKNFQVEEYEELTMRTFLNLRTHLRFSCLLALFSSRPGAC